MTISFDAGNAPFDGSLALPEEAVGTVVLAHATASGSAHSSRNRFISERLNGAGLATLMCDPAPEDEAVAADAPLAGDVSNRRVDIERLAQRIVTAVDRLHDELPTAGLPLATMGAGAGGAALLASSWFKRHLGVGMPTASETAGG